MSDRISTNGLKSTKSVLAEDVHILEKPQERNAVIRVAAYCRVSTNMEIQQKSLDTQMTAFSRIIEEHPGWVLAGIYADKGLSGTTVKHREEFKRMIEDAKAGKINYILVKSISRFSRNTVDALAYVRELKSYGVSVFFEKEKLDTGKVVSEFLLSIFAASAQEEIISLSNNIKVGKRMRFAAGIAQWTHIYGYRCTKDGTWVVEPEEAKIVRRIFDEYVSGRSLPEICRGLMEDGIPSTGGKQVWMPKSMASLLHNEKYIGDIRMQKSYVSDPIQHNKMDNRDATLKQYYKENHHEPIVDRHSYEMAQMIAAMKDFHRGTSQYPYYGFLKCPICGQNMIRCLLPRNNHVFAWTCGGKHTENGNLRKQRTACPAYYIMDAYLEEAFWNAIKSIDKNELTTIANETDSEKAAAAQAMLLLKRDAPRKAKAAAKMHAPGRHRISELYHAVEYKNLCDTVQSISFPLWTVMKTEWKCGITTSTTIEYSKASDMPYPTIRKEEAEDICQDTQKCIQETYVVNGVPIINGRPDLQFEGILIAREAIQNTTILEPLVYEPPVPRVFSFSSISIERKDKWKPDKRTKGKTEDKKEAKE